MAKEYLEDYPVEPGFRGPFNSGCDIVNNIVRSWIKGKIVIPVVYIEDRPSAEEYVGGIGNLNNAGNSNSTPQHTYNTNSNNQNVQGDDGNGQSLEGNDGNEDNDGDDDSDDDDTADAESDFHVYLEQYLKKKRGHGIIILQM